MADRRLDPVSFSGASGFPDGVLVIDKPAGPTSHDIVALARRALGISRIGHTGTLDPLATGVLPLVVGRATRLAQYFSAGHKEYDATVAFGRATDTYDTAGTLVSTSPDRPTRAQLEAAVEACRGTFEQTPPAYSAKSIDGTRAYALARRGGDAPARRPEAVVVTVERLEVMACDGETARLSMRVTSGFYVRSLAHDLGAALGMGAVLQELRRTRSGEFDLSQAVPLEQLLRSDRVDLAQRLVPFDHLLPNLPSAVLNPTGVARVRNGLEVGPADLETRLESVHPLTRLLDPAGHLVALAAPGKAPGFLHAAAVFGVT